MVRGKKQNVELENMQLYKQESKKRENGIEIKEIIINFVFGICHAERPERGNKRVGSDFYKQGVYLTLVFQTVNFATLQITEDKMATQMPTVGILYTLPWVVVYIRLVLATGRVYMKMEEDPNYFFKETDRKSTRVNSSHQRLSRMPSSA